MRLVNAKSAPCTIFSYALAGNNLSGGRKANSAVVVMEAATATAAAPVHLEVSLPTSLTSPPLGSINLSGDSSLYYEDCRNSSMAFAHSLSYALENSLRLWQVNNRHAEKIVC